MPYTFIITYTVERESGKFAPAEEIEEALMTALEEASPDLYGLGTDGDSVYYVQDVDIRPIGKHERVLVTTGRSQ